jgi:hypothetical protein
VVAAFSPYTSFVECSRSLFNTHALLQRNVSSLTLSPQKPHLPPLAPEFIGRYSPPAPRISSVLSTSSPEFQVIALPPTPSPVPSVPSHSGFPLLGFRVDTVAAAAAPASSVVIAVLLPHLGRRELGAAGRCGLARHLLPRGGGRQPLGAYQRASGLLGAGHYFFSPESFWLLPLLRLTNRCRAMTALKRWGLGEFFVPSLPSRTADGG